MHGIGCEPDLAGSDLLCHCAKGEGCAVCPGVVCGQRPTIVLISYYWTLGAYTAWFGDYMIIMSQYGNPLKNKSVFQGMIYNLKIFNTAHVAFRSTVFHPSVSDELRRWAMGLATPV